MLTDEYMKSEEFYNILSKSGDNWLYIPGQYPILDISVLVKDEKSVELEVENTKQNFDISTEIEKDASGNIKGGTITGTTSAPIYTTGRKYVETVNYGESSTKEIKIQPSSGYKIANIEINDNAISFEPEIDGSYEIPIGYFDNVTEAKHVKVTFANTENLITINKTDDEENKLNGAKFKIESDSVSVGNGLGELTTNGSSGFTVDSRGYIVPSNTKESAYSYYKIDLTHETDDVSVMLESYEGYGSVLYAKIAEDTNVSDEVNAKDCFSYAKATYDNKSYTSNILKPGKVYYLQLGFIPSQSSLNNITTDYTYIRNVKLMKVENTELELVNNGENILEPDGTGYAMKNTTTTDTSDSYIPIDLSNKSGNYVISFDTEFINSGAYIMLTESTEVPEYDYSKVILSTGGANVKQSASKILEGGKKYYIHIEFTPFKDVEVTSFKIDNITLYSEYNKLILETNANGQILYSAKPGTYTVTEVEAPKGYAISEESKTITISSGESKELTFENQKQKEAIVHYYIKGTENYSEPIKLKDDVYMYGNKGDEYNAAKYIETELQGYTLEVDDNKEYILPENITGKYGDDVIHINYYYEKLDNKKTKITAKKLWNVPDSILNKYKVTIKLVKIENGKEVDVYDEDGNDLAATITGNGEVVFNKLKVFENGEKIQYKVKEVKVEKFETVNNETQEEVWVKVPLNQFETSYTVNED